MALLTLRYDLRAPAALGASHAELYAACLEQCAWGDSHGFTTIVVSEHHGIDDGFLPSPLVMAGAIGARTKSALIMVSALLVPLHDPLRLAEDIAVVDILTNGRIGVVAGLGYRDEEFEMFGVDRQRRGRIAEEKLKAMLDAWASGRTTPVPLTKPHPLVLVGGSTDAAAKRAARLHLPFLPAIGDPALEEVYRAECGRIGFADGFTMLPTGPGFVHVTDDPERDWARIGPHLLYEAQTYHSWQTPGQRSQVHVDAHSVDDLRTSGVYRIVTPDECVALATELGPTGSIVFHPLVAGLSPEIAWESLELFANKVQPRLS